MQGQYFATSAQILHSATRYSAQFPSPGGHDSKAALPANFGRHGRGWEVWTLLGTNFHQTLQTPGPSWTPLHTYKTYRSYSISEHPVYYCIFVSERLYCDPRCSHLSMSANTSNTSKTSTSVFIRGMDIYSWFVGLPTYIVLLVCAQYHRRDKDWSDLVSMF